MSKNDKIDELYIKLGQYIQILERLKNFFNGDNVLTKSEYKQKILEGDDVVECPMHHLPAIPDKNMIYQCRKCVEETKERNNDCC